MVFEFPELQGIMGGYYAEVSGESKAVAQAIREHYQPTQAGGAIPSTPAGQIVALADRLDTILGIFKLGVQPSATRDPFGLRRASLGVLRICIEGGLPLNLRAVFEKTAKIMKGQIGWGGSTSFTTDAATIDKELSAAAANTAGLAYEFVLERLRAYYESLPTEMFEAVKTRNITEPLDFDTRIKALQNFWALPAAKNLAAAHKRVRNILKQSGDAGMSGVDAALFEHAAEKTLAAKMAALPKTGDYTDKLKNLATLREPVDAFFEGVMVNAENVAVRNNRLALLRQLDGLCREVADISLLPG
jgi:glycyl-tRNA synthetase beta chain